MDALDLTIEALYLLATGYFLFFLLARVFGYSFLVGAEQPQRWIIVGSTAAAVAAFVVYFVAFYRGAANDPTAIANYLALVAVLAVLELLRIFLDRHEDSALAHTQGGKHWKYASDFGANATLYAGLYAAVLHPSYPAYAVAGWLLCAANLFRVLKYRIYDDLYRRQLALTGSYRSSDQVTPGQAPPHVTLLQGLYNVFLRTYIYVSTTYAFAYLLLVSNSPSGASAAFKFEKSSGNLFVDFFYYSVFQLGMGGYGEIAPASVHAKLLSASEMLFGYLILGSILALILGRTSSPR